MGKTDPMYINVNRDSPVNTRDRGTIKGTVAPAYKWRLTPHWTVDRRTERRKLAQPAQRVWVNSDAITRAGLGKRSGIARGTVRKESRTWTVWSQELEELRNIGMEL